MSPLLTKILLLSAGGAIGALARYGFGGWVQNRFPNSTFPWGTLCVNVLGSFVIGFLFILVEERPVLSPSARLFLMIGVLGAFTTFSSFSLETVNLMAKSQWLAAGLNVTGSVVVCLVAVMAGMSLARAL